MSSAARPSARVDLRGRPRSPPVHLVRLVTHLLDDAAQLRDRARGRRSAAPPCRCCSTGRPSARSRATILSTRHDLAQVAGHRRLQRQQRVARSSSVRRPRVDLVIAQDHVLGAFEILLEQDVGDPRDQLDDIRADSLATSLRISSSSLWNLRPEIVLSSAEPSRDVVLRGLVGRVGEDRLACRPSRSAVPGLPVPSMLKNAVRSLTRAACCMLWVTITIVYLLLQLDHQLLDRQRRDRVERRARLVHQQHVGLDRDRAGDAQPLLLTARQARAGLVQAVLDLLPQVGARSDRLDDGIGVAPSSCACVLSFLPASTLS